MELIIDFLEKRIVQCQELGDMEREAWAFKQCLKEVRKLSANTPSIANDNSEVLKIKNMLKECRAMKKNTKTVEYQMYYNGACDKFDLLHSKLIHGL